MALRTLPYLRLTVFVEVAFIGLSLGAGVSVGISIRTLKPLKHWLLGRRNCCRPSLRCFWPWGPTRWSYVLNSDLFQPIAWHPVALTLGDNCDLPGGLIKVWNSSNDQARGKGLFSWGLCGWSWVCRRSQAMESGGIWTVTTAYLLVGSSRLASAPPISIWPWRCWFGPRMFLLY